MYYIVWKGSLRDRKIPYFIGLDESYHWGPLEKAKGFASEVEAKAHINTPITSHWLLCTNIVFIHPLNYQARCLRDI